MPQTLFLSILVMHESGLVRSGTKYRWFTVTDCIFTKITLKQKEKLGRAMNPSMDKSSLKISFRYKTRA